MNPVPDDRSPASEKIVETLGRMGAELAKLRAESTRHTELLRSLAYGSDRSAVPDEERQRERATQTALWLICDDETLEEHARVLGSPAELRSWTERALSGTASARHLDDVDYQRLHGLLR